MHEIITDWVNNGHSGLVSVMYFSDGISFGTQRAALAGLWSEIDGALDNNTTWTVRTTGRQIAEANGQIVANLSDATTWTGTGGVTGEAVNDAAQILLRWKTNTIAGRRFVQGRQYVPGSAAVQQVGGNFASTVAATITGLVQTFAQAGTGFGIWHRPTKVPNSNPPQYNNDGVLAPVVSGSCWTEFASQRRRRL